MIFSGDIQKNRREIVRASSSASAWCNQAASGIADACIASRARCFRMRVRWALTTAVKCTFHAQRRNSRSSTASSAAVASSDAALSDGISRACITDGEDSEAGLVAAEPAVAAERHQPVRPKLGQRVVNLEVCCLSHTAQYCLTCVIQLGCVLLGG